MSNEEGKPAGRAFQKEIAFQQGVQADQNIRSREVLRQFAYHECGNRETRAAGVWFDNSAIVSPFKPTRTVTLKPSSLAGKVRAAMIFGAFPNAKHSHSQALGGS